MGEVREQKPEKGSSAALISEFRMDFYMVKADDSFADWFCRSGAAAGTGTVERIFGLRKLADGKWDGEIV